MREAKKGYTAGIKQDKKCKYIFMVKSEGARVAHSM